MSAMAAGPRLEVWSARQSLGHLETLSPLQNMHLRAESGARAAASRRRRDPGTAAEKNLSNRSRR